MWDRDVMANNPQKFDCWICNAAATTGEHKTKRSDLRDVFGPFVKRQKLFLNSKHEKNKKIQSIDSSYLKSSARICEKCNSDRTQPFDKSWEELSTWLRTQHRFSKTETYFRTDAAFKTKVDENLKNLQLFFVKHLGLRVVEAETRFRL